MNQTTPTPELVALADRLELMAVNIECATTSKEESDLRAAADELRTRAATVPQGVSDQDAGEPIWTKVKPFAAGVYGVRGYQLGVDPADQFEAIVAVRRGRSGELVCNMHECTTEDDLRDWGLVSDISDKFEWCRFVPDTTPPPAELGKGESHG